jgi:hypothetical protein
MGMGELSRGLAKLVPKWLLCAVPGSIALAQQENYSTCPGAGVSILTVGLDNNIIFTLEKFYIIL